MNTNIVLGTQEQAKGQHDEYLVFSPNRIHDSSIEMLPTKLEESPNVRNDLRGRPNIEL